MLEERPMSRSKASAANGGRHTQHHFVGYECLTVLVSFERRVHYRPHGTAPALTNKTIASGCWTPAARLAHATACSNAPAA